MPDQHHEQVARQIVSASYHVHRTLGPGLLESVYETCLAYELSRRGLCCKRQTSIAIVYEQLRFEEGFRLDLLVEDIVICELKSVDVLLPVHTAQIITYLRLTGKRLGFLINFNVPVIKQGIKRLIL